MLSLFVKENATMFGGLITA